MNDTEYEFEPEPEVVGDDLYKENRDLAIEVENRELHERRRDPAIQIGDELVRDGADPEEAKLISEKEVKNLEYIVNAPIHTDEEMNGLGELFPEDE